MQVIRGVGVSKGVGEQRSREQGAGSREQGVFLPFITGGLPTVGHS